MLSGKPIQLMEKQKTTRAQRVGGSLLLSAGALVVGVYLYAGYLNYFAATPAQPDQAEPQVAGDSTDYPAMYTNHRDYRCGGTCATKNLLPEESSFEVGVKDQFDGLTFLRRMGYEDYAPGSGDIFSSDPTKGYVVPSVTSERYVDGARSFKAVNNHPDGLVFEYNWIQVPTTGKYVFSVYAKAENLQGSATQILTSLDIIDKEWNPVMEGSGDRWLAESAAGNSGWVRLSVATDVDLLAGEFYRPAFQIGSRLSPSITGTFYLDAMQFELAENQSNPQPSSFAYQTTAQELYAYTSTDAPGVDAKRGNTFWTQDNETVYGQIQIREAAPLASGSQVKWWLYDTNGDSTNTATALASGITSVNPSPASFQTVTLNLSSELASAAPTAGKGVWKTVVELWDPTGTTMVDREFLIFGRIEASPYVGQALPDSFYGNHVSLSIRTNDYSNYFGRYYQQIQANRPVHEYWSTAEKLGIKASREFGLLEQDLVQRQEELGLADPFFMDFVDTMTAHHIDLFPVLGQRHNNGDADAQWQSFVSDAVSAYGPKISAYEVLNEPKEESIPFLRYYGYLWRAEEAIHSLQPDALVIGPSASGDYFANLLAYSDGVHSTGFDLFSRSANHIYFRYQNGMRNIPEVAENWAFEDVDEAMREWQEIFDAAAPDEASRKKTWITEIGINQTRLYDDVPFIAHNGWTGDEALFYDHMSGSVPIAKKLASDFLRYELYQLANGLEKSYEFGLFVATIADSTMYGFFDFDGTPLPIAPAFAQMTKRLEQSPYVRRVESPELRANGTYTEMSRAFLFSSPDLDQPGATRPTAVVWNWEPAGTGAELLNIPLAANLVDVEDVYGNPIDVGSGETFSLPIDSAPRYIIGRSGVTMSQLAYALDKLRPSGPFAPTASVEGERVKLVISRVLAADIDEYRIYREPASGGEAVFVGSVAARAEAMTWYDDPPTGDWKYRVTAVEQGTEYETGLSGPSGTVSVNASPVWVEQSDLEIHEDDQINVLLTVTDINPEDTITITSNNLPPGATLTDHGNKTATLAWRPDLEQANVYPVLFDAFDGREHVEMSVTITVLDGRSECTPQWICTPWSVCADNRQTRTCTDELVCGTDAGRPEEIRACDSFAPRQIDDLDVE